jgi:hypothetical protein
MNSSKVNILKNITYGVVFVHFFSSAEELALLNLVTASIYVKIETRGLVSSQWKKYIKYSVYHVTDLANEIVRKPHM